MDSLESYTSNNRALEHQEIMSMVNIN